MFKTCVRVLCLKALAAGENNHPQKTLFYLFYFFLFVLIVGCGEILSTVFNPVVHFKPQSYMTIFFFVRGFATTTTGHVLLLWLVESCGLFYCISCRLQDRTELEVDVFIWSYLCKYEFHYCSSCCWGGRHNLIYISSVNVNVLCAYFKHITSVANKRQHF